MTELYSFIFCIALGIAGRILFMAFDLLAKRTDLLPVTVILDILAVSIVGAAFTLYVILSGALLAPYMFAALFAGYLFTYWLTKSAKKKRRDDKNKKNQDPHTLT